MIIISLFGYCVYVTPKLCQKSVLHPSLSLHLNQQQFSSQIYHFHGLFLTLLFLHCEDIDIEILSSRLKFSNWNNIPRLLKKMIMNYLQKALFYTIAEHIFIPPLHLRLTTKQINLATARSPIWNFAVRFSRFNRSELETNISIKGTKRSQHSYPNSQLFIQILGPICVTEKLGREVLPSCIGIQPKQQPQDLTTKNG